MARGMDERHNPNRKVDRQSRGVLGRNHPLMVELRQQRQESGIYNFWPRDREVDRRLRERPNKRSTED